MTELVRNFPDTALLRVDLARHLRDTGNVGVLQDETGRRGTRGKAVGHWESLLAARPGVPSYHGGLGIALGNLGWSTKDRPDESRRHLLRGTLEVLVALRANPDDPVFRHSLRQQTRNLADNLVLAGDDAEIARQSERIRDGLPGHPYGMLRAVCFLARATTTLKNGQAPPAEKTRRTDAYCRQASH